MPVHFVVDNDARLFVSRFSGVVTRDEAVELTRRLAAATDGEGSYRSLIIFDAALDLSSLDTDALRDILKADIALYERPGMARAAGAAVLDSAVDAHVIMPLYNALCDAVPGIDMHFELFDRLDPALDWLGVPRETGEPLAARTKRDAEAISDGGAPDAKS